MAEMVDAEDLKFSGAPDWRKKMERNVKFAEGASLQCIDVILPESLIARIREKSVSLHLAPEMGLTGVDVFVEKALEHYLEAIEKGYSTKASKKGVDERLSHLEVILSVSLIVRLRKECSGLQLPRRRMRDVFIERALEYYLEFLEVDIESMRTTHQVDKLMEKLHNKECGKSAATD